MIDRQYCYVYRCALSQVNNVFKIMVIVCVNGRWRYRRELLDSYLKDADSFKMLHADNVFVGRGSTPLIEGYAS